MSFWTAIVVIVLIGAVASVLRSRYNAQAGITEDMMGNQTLNRSGNYDEASNREIEELRERIKVLERIATDNNSLDAQERARISQEIEKLRDDTQTTKQD